MLHAIVVLISNFLPIFFLLSRNSGIAVGFMREAKAELHALKKVSKSTLSITHSAVAFRASKEEEVVTDLLGTLTRLNDTVS